MAIAADDGHDLYWLDSSNRLTKVEGAKFTAVGTIQASANGHVCATDTNGITWTIPLRDIKTPPTQAGYQTCVNLHDINEANDYALPLHSVVWSASYAQIDNEDTAKGVANTSAMGIDETGRLWYTMSRGKTTAENIYPGLHFIDAASDMNYSAVGNGVTLFLADPIETPNGITILQMPQSGDPAASTWQAMPVCIALVCIELAFFLTGRRGESRHRI